MAAKSSRLFDKTSTEPFKLSRSKIELFVRCPRCFYLDRCLGIAQPPSYPLSLNSAVDFLLKKEFDLLRAKGEAHELMKLYNVDAVPFAHEKLDQWRNNFIGASYIDTQNNLHIFGAVDDLWINSSGELIIVDYKATSKEQEVDLDQDWQDGYRRQMEIYQHIFLKNGFKVSKTGYFVYCNGKKDAQKFDAKLEFSIKLIPYTGNTDWIEPALKNIKDVLIGDSIPKAAADCAYCAYVSKINQVAKE